MVLKLATLAAPNAIQRPRTPQWEPPRPAIMPLLTSSGHARGDCSTVHLEADANLEAHLNTNLDVSGATTQPADRLTDQTTTQPTGQLCHCTNGLARHCQAVWQQGTGTCVSTPGVRLPNRTGTDVSRPDRRRRHPPTGAGQATGRTAVERQDDRRAAGPERRSVPRRRSGTFQRRADDCPTAPVLIF